MPVENHSKAEAHCEEAGEAWETGNGRALVGNEIEQRQVQPRKSVGISTVLDDWQPMELPGLVWRWGEGGRTMSFYPLAATSTPTVCYIDCSARFLSLEALKFYN